MKENAPPHDAQWLRKEQECRNPHVERAAKLSGGPQIVPSAIENAVNRGVQLFFERREIESRDALSKHVDVFVSAEICFYIYAKCYKRLCLQRPDVLLPNLNFVRIKVVSISMYNYHRVRNIFDLTD